MSCHRLAPLGKPGRRRLLGSGASVGPVRRIAFGCGLAVAIGGGVVAARPPAVPGWLKPAPAAIEQPGWGDPVAVAEPGGALLFGGAVAVLLGLRAMRRRSGRP